MLTEKKLYYHSITRDDNGLIDGTKRGVDDADELPFILSVRPLIAIGEDRGENEDEVDICCCLCITFFPLGDTLNGFVKLISTLSPFVVETDNNFGDLIRFINNCLCN